jgi:hypothetical protein
MNSPIRWAAAALFTLAIPALADDKPSTPSSPAPAKPEAKKYVEIGKMVGKLDKVTTASSEITLEIPGRYRSDKKDLTLADDVKVWFRTPPEKIDENGNSRKMTPSELDKAKSRSGATKGLYAGDMTNLRSGQQVQLVLGKPKDAVKKPAPKDKNAAPEPDFQYVTQIVVLSDEKPPTKPDSKKK